MNQEELKVELPGGGHIYLQSAEEVDRWSTLSDSYRRDYRLTKINDLTMLGTLLQQHIGMFRSQLALSGMEPEVDEEQLPTGRLKKVDLKPADQKRYTEAVTNASKEIREIEKAMGIDKKSRDQSGSETVLDWMTRLKSAGHSYGIHIRKRVKALEEFANELRWRVRLMNNGDAEDRAYHDCTPDGILKWAEEQLEALEEVDREFAREHADVIAIGRVA